VEQGLQDSQAQSLVEVACGVVYQERQAPYLIVLIRGDVYMPGAGACPGQRLRRLKKAVVNKECFAIRSGA